MDKAKQVTSDSYWEYKFCQRNGVPVVSKGVSNVAKLYVSDLELTYSIHSNPDVAH